MTSHGARASALGSPAATEEERERFVRYQQTRDRRQRDEIIVDYQWLVRYCARRFAGRGEPLEDLIQVAQLGLLKALERYDPDYGSTFAAFATPTITGELKRHFRDRTWPVRVPRRVSDLLVSIGAALDALSQSLGRTPTVPELARYLQVAEDDVLEALDAGAAYRSQPLTADAGGSEPDRGRFLSVEDTGLEPLRLDVMMALRDLSTTEQRVVQMRFFQGMTQSEIAARIGTSQVTVSRWLERIYRRLETRTH